MEKKERANFGLLKPTSKGINMYLQNFHVGPNTFDGRFSNKFTNVGYLLCIGLLDQPQSKLQERPCLSYITSTSDLEPPLAA